MCGRFTFLLSPELLAIIFGRKPPEQLTSRYNIAPTQQVLIVRQSIAGENYFSTVRWGLIPHWAKDLSIGSRMINARCETVHEKPTFRQAIRTRRCIVLASGFFEWKSTPDEKVPYYVTMLDGGPLLFAGIWGCWKSPEGTALETCSILTTAANSLMAAIHDRMPVILGRNAIAKWVNPIITNPRELQDLYQPYPSELMQACRVSTLVNSPRNDSSACIERIAP